MPRLSEPDPKSLSPKQQAVRDAILSGPRGKVEGPLGVWLHSAALADKAQQLGAFCRYQTSLPARLSELAIITVGAWWQAGFEWHVHAPLAAAAGIDPAHIETIRTGGIPDFAQGDEAVVHRFTRELLAQRRVTDATYAMALEALGETTLVELVGIIGYYGFISMTINAFEVPVPPGAPEPFGDRR